MRLEDLTEKKETKGSYAGVHFSKETTDAVSKYSKDNEVPNPLSGKKMHSTLLYSRKYLPNYKPAGKYEKPMSGKPGSFEIWESQPDEDGDTKNCLVLKYNCPELKECHEKLMKEHEATFDYPNFQPHITLSYDVGEFDVDKLPKFEDNIIIVEEYYEDLDLDWASNNK